MTVITVRWHGGVDGWLEAQTDAGQTRRLGNLKEAADFLRVNFAAFDETSAMTAGAAALYLAIRECDAWDRIPVLERAERILDAAYVVVPNRETQAWIDSGVDHVRYNVFPVRTDSYEQIAATAHASVRSIDAEFNKGRGCSSG
jgi:hypothetical protein